MYLKSLEMQGFKSFPDKTTLHFGKGITAVVGPNGSGKSNISDAVRWVLGEQSTKSLRGSKMEDVVFLGTSTRRAVGYAEVTLQIDNSDKALNSDEKEVSVTRRYYRSGESEYQLNGQSVRLKDVHELFMDTGLGRDGYSVVSQGRITDMISARAVDRRDMFEEAAGISHYRYRRADALKRLEQAEENLVRLRDILSELESRIEPLRVQSEKAAQFLEYAAEKKTLEIGLWLRTIERTRDNLSEQETRLTTADIQHKEAEKELTDIENKIEKTIAETQRLTVLIDNARRASGELDEKAVTLEGQIAVLENSILHNSEVVARIERDKLSEDDTSKHLASQIEEEQEEIKALTEQIEAEKETLQGVTGEMNALTEESDQKSGSYMKLSGELSGLSVELADCRVALSTAGSTVTGIDERLSAIAEASAARQQTITQLEAQRAEVQGNLDAVCEKIVGLNNSLEGLVLRAEGRHKKLEELKTEERRLQNELELCVSRKNMLSDLEKNMEGYQGAVKAVMRELKRGALTGIHAPVSQLITVKEQYALAVETALGAQIQNIVTDNENDAKRAIAFLKESSAGRATFLPLTAIRGKELDEKGLDSCLGYIDLASNLVECDKKYRQIVLSQLGRTVVAEDMDAAVVIGKKYDTRFRIVTLDGQVINAGGSMTGGSKTPSAGMLSRVNEIEKLGRKAEELKIKLESVKQNVKTAAESVGACEAQLTGHKSEMTAAGEDKIRLEGVLALREGQLSALTAQEAEQEAERAEITAKKETFQKKMALAEQTIALLSKKLAETESALADITGDRERLHERREGLTVKIQECNLRIVAREKEIEAKRETVERLERRGSSHTVRITELNAEIAELEAKNGTLHADIESLRAEVQKLREESGQSAGNIARFMKLREDAESESGSLRLLERAKTGERERLSGEVVRLEERKAAMMREYDEICQKLFEDYELTRREAEQLGYKIENVGQAQKRLSELKNKIKALGSVNVGAIEEYKEVSERFKFLSGQIEDIEASKAELIKMIEELTEKMAARFKASFKDIAESFGETFRELFDGGSASLALTDERDILESGIEIKVQPPGKNVQNIDLFSGGEKVLSAIALLFAILKVAPAPFCIYDEVEAALDDVNVGRYAAYVRRMTANTQFILITHRRGTMEEADMLYGVTMQEEGVSKLLELRTAQMARELGLE